MLQTRYRLTCVKEEQSAALGAGASDEAAVSERLLARIRAHVPEAMVLTDVGTELTVGLPTAALPQFAPLLAELGGLLPRSALHAIAPKL